MFLPRTWQFIVVVMTHFFVGTLTWDRKICSFDIEIRNSPQSIFKSVDATVTPGDIMKCTVLDGDFTVSMINEKTNATFPLFENIIEITGNLVIFNVLGLKSVDEILPNLRVIGGNSLLSNSALIIFQNDDLEYIGLNKLAIIRKGGIRITDNSKLCYSRFINWKSIVIEKNANIFIEQRDYVDDNNGHLFHQCQDIYGCKVNIFQKCNKINNILSCWNSTTCQQYCPYHKLENDLIGPGCTPQGEKCHSSCIGGCFEMNNSSSCYACQKFELNNVCVNQCPSDMFVYKSHRCISKAECHSLLPAKSEFRRKKVLWKAFYGKCHFECPVGYQENPKSPHGCIFCKDGFCPKTCLGDFVDSAERALKFSKCNIIDGNLTIMLHYSGNSGEKLRKAFKNIREIKGYLLVHYSPILASLSMFQSLQIIHGESLINGRYALAIFEMENLRKLFDVQIEQNLFIKNGSVNFQNNPKLCFDKITKFMTTVKMLQQKNITDLEALKYSNGEKAICNEFELNVNVTLVSSVFFVISWKNIIDEKKLLGYKIFWKKIDKIDPKMEIDEDRCTCGDTWKMKFVQYEDKEYMTDWMENLFPNSIYAFYVQAQIIHHHHFDAKNYISKVSFAQTLFSFPDPSTWKKVYSPTPESIYLEWNPPLNANGIITHYIVRWAASEPSYSEYTHYDDPCGTWHKEIFKNTDDSKLNSYDFDNIYLKEEAGERDIFEDTLLNKLLPPSDKDYIYPENRISRSIDVTFSTKTNFTDNNNNTVIPLLHVINQTNTSGSVNVTTTKFHITGLTFFTWYSIQILACQDVTAQEHYCSRSALVEIVRTKPKPENDIVDINTVKVYKYIVDGINQEDCRIINWSIPENPNGVILGFEYKLWRDKDMQSLVRCINKRNFIKNGGILIKGLSNGFHNFELQTISSAGFSTSIVLKNLFEVYVPGWLTWKKVVLIVIGIAAAITFFSWLIYRHYKKYLHRKVQQYLTISANSEYPLIDIYKKDEWELKREDLIFYDEIGRGTFGKVFSGEGKGITSKCGTKFGKCAIKAIPECACHSERMHFLLEASVMKQFDTAYIVKLYGVVSEGNPVLLVMELMEKGNLRDFLRSRRPNSDENINNAPLPTKQCYFKWACQIADGMAYLEAQKFVHRDLAARNCMVTNDETVKIGDFGMARDIYYHEYYKPIGRRLMPVRWMAPESLKDGKFTVKSDAWSYGIVLYEMITLGQQPYAGLRNDQVYDYIERKRNIIICPVNCPKFWYNLMKKCWIYNARDRPCFYQIFLYLKDTIEKCFKNGNKESMQVFDNSFVCKNYDGIEKTIYDFTTAAENEDIRKHPLLEEIDKATISQEDLHSGIVAFMANDDFDELCDD